MRDNIYAVVICYNPDIGNLLENIKSISGQVSKIVIIDNNSTNYSEYASQVEGLYKVELIKLYKNKGIAEALNIGLNYCSGKCQWFVSLDQDSCADSNMVKNLLMISDENDGIIAPLIIDRNSVAVNGVDYTHLTSLTAITSGCLNNVDILSKVGGFDSRLFIDFVDHEVCLRLTKFGYPIKHSKDAILYHSVGNITTHRVLGKRIITTNHAPFRRYFLFRNRILVYKRYISQFPKWCLKGFVFMFRDIFVIMIFENKRMQNIKYILKGIYHGITNNYDNSIIKN